MRRQLVFFSLAALVVFLDQASKWWIRSTLSLGESLPPQGFFRLTFVTNTGAAFGLFPDQAVPLTFTAAIGVVALLLHYRWAVSNSLWLKGSLGLQLGGAIGNLIDRLRFGHVIDFLDFRVWPVFNLADSAIVMGAGILVYFLLFANKPAPLDQRQTRRS